MQRCDCLCKWMFHMILTKNIFPICFRSAVFVCAPNALLSWLPRYIVGAKLPLASHILKFLLSFFYLSEYIHTFYKLVSVYQYRLDEK